MEIFRNGTRPSDQGSIEQFTGSVRIETLLRTQPPARTQGASVTFEPKARTAWHAPPLGQTLIVISGRGLVQSWGGAVEEIRPGDAVWAPPGEKHWHGGADTTPLTVIAVQEALDGKVVEWMEKVSEEEYGKSRR